MRRLRRLTLARGWWIGAMVCAGGCEGMQSMPTAPEESEAPALVETEATASSASPNEPDADVETDAAVTAPRKVNLRGTHYRPPPIIFVDGVRLSEEPRASLAGIRPEDIA